ncbi:MAG: CsbD family protein [Synechococcaceae cyanobacterium ELA182]
MKATAKNLEGKAQEITGNITGDKTDQLAGKAKQAQASGEHAVEGLKDAVHDATN